MWDRHTEQESRIILKERVLDRDGVKEKDGSAEQRTGEMKGLYSEQKQ